MGAEKSLPHIMFIQVVLFFTVFYFIFLCNIHSHIWQNKIYWEPITVAGSGRLNWPGIYSAEFLDSVFKNRMLPAYLWQRYRA